MLSDAFNDFGDRKRTQLYFQYTHTHTYIYIYKYIFSETLIDILLGSKMLLNINNAYRMPVIITSKLYNAVTKPWPLYNMIR